MKHSLLFEAVLVAMLPSFAMAYPQTSDSSNPGSAAYLAKQVESARKSGNVGLEIDALQRLILVDNNPMNRVELLRVQLKANRISSANAQRAVNDICSLGSSYACNQAKNLLSNSGTGSTANSQRISLYAKAGQYQKALDLMEKTYGGVPKDENSRLQYYEMMLKVPGRRSEAVNNLRDMAQSSDVTPIVRRKARQLYEPAYMETRSEEVGTMLSTDRSRQQGLRELDRLIKENPNATQVEDWKKMQSNGTFWDELYQARRAVARKDSESVRKHLAAAEALAPANEKYNLDLVRASQAETQMNFKGARDYYDRAMKQAKDPVVKDKINRMIRENVAKENSYRKDMARVEAQRAEAQKQRELFEQEKNLEENEENLRLLISRHPSDPYYRFRLAQFYMKQGRKTEAKELFSKMPAGMLRNNRWGYFYALILERDNKQEALNVLKNIKNPDADTRNLRASLEETLLIAKAQKCYEDANLTCVNKILTSLKKDTDEVRLLRAKYNVASGKSEDAKQYFAALEKDANHRVEAILEGANILLAEGDRYGAIEKLNEVSPVDQMTPDRALYAAHLYDKAEDVKEAVPYLKKIEEENGEQTLSTDQKLYVADLYQKANEKDDSLNFLRKVEPSMEPMSLDQTLYIANLYKNAGESKDALRHLEKGANQPGKKEDRVKANTSYAQALAEEGERDKAIGAYKKAFHVAGLTKRENVSNAEFTEAMQAPNMDEDKYKNNTLVNEASRFYQEVTPSITGGVQILSNSGESGASELQRTTAMVNYTRPFMNGQLSFQADYVGLDTGAPNRNPEYAKIGTCFSTGCTGEATENIDGISLSATYKKDNWGFDVGSTPIGFLYNTVVGSAHYGFQLDDEQSLTVTAYRRAKKDSVLSYSGMKDPNPHSGGAKWGGVVRTGGRVDYSNEWNPIEGVWARGGYEILTGNNVDSNSALYLMGGYYQKLIRKTNEQWQVGVNAMALKYRNNQDQYTYGSGGYFSPQRYLSMSLVSEYKWRNPNWSVSLGGEVGYQMSRSDSMPRYRRKDSITWSDSMNDLWAVTEGKQSNGLKYAFNANVERRITPRLVAGLSVDLKHSPNWKPVSALLYLRHTFDDWKGSLPMPPLVPTPYSDLDGL